MVFVDKTSVLTPEDLNIGCSDKFVDHFDEDMVEDEVGHGVTNCDASVTVTLVWTLLIPERASP